MQNFQPFFGFSFRDFANYFGSFNFHFQPKLRAFNNFANFAKAFYGRRNQPHHEQSASLSRRPLRRGIFIGNIKRNLLPGKFAGFVFYGAYRRQLLVERNIRFVRRTLFIRVTLLPDLSVCGKKIARKSVIIA